MIHRWFYGAAMIIGISTVLSGCGGGTNTASPGAASAAKSVVSTGVVTGFGGAEDGVQYASGSGSFFVNGVEYDAPSSGVKSTGEQMAGVKLGMAVTLRGTVSEDELRGTADQLDIENEIKGPVGEIDAASGKMTVLGQSITVDSNTVFEGAGGLAALSVADMVEVSGLADSGGVVLASRIEKMPSPFIPNKTEVKVSGKVDDTYGYNFTMGGLTVYNKGQVAGIGRKKKAHATGTVSNTYGQTLYASRVDVDEDEGDGRDGREERGRKDKKAHVSGFVTDFKSMASFKVNNVSVDARDIDVSGIANNVNVRVRGYMSGNVLVATKLRIVKNGPAGGPAPAPLPIDGAALYASKCASCHGPLASSDVSGTTVSKTQSAINKNEGNMGTLSNLGAAELQAIANALARVPAPPAPAPDPAPAPVDGAALYGSKCASCHGALATSNVKGTTASRIQSKHGNSSILSGVSSTGVQAIADALAIASAPAASIDGAALYSGNCASCHGPISSFRGRTAAQTQSAIDKNQGGMGYLSTLTTEQLEAIANASR